MKQKRKKRNLSSSNSKKKSKTKHKRLKTKKTKKETKRNRKQNKTKKTTLKKQTSKADKNIIIKIQNLNKQFHNKEILKNINLSIKKKEIFGLIGMSGSGKTTLLNLIIGFHYADFGKIYYNHGNKLIESNKDLALMRQKIGFAPQEPSFYPKLTALENLEHFGSLYNISHSVILANANALLKLTRLEQSKHTLAQELSFGMQKRLGIICALIHKPELIILDEPTADLDPILREEILSLILKIKKKGITVIIASHFLDDMEEICDRVAIIKNGRIIKCASVKDIKKSLPSKHANLTTLFKALEMSKCHKK